MDERVEPLCGPQRLDLQRPRRRHPDRHQRAGATQSELAVYRSRIGLHQYAIALAGVARPISPATGTPRRCWPGRSWRSGRTRRTSLVISYGPKPASNCSRSPPIPGPMSSKPKECGRGCGSVNAGSRRSSTCSRRTSAISRRCCRRCPTRIRSPNSPPDAPLICRSYACTTAPYTGGTGRCTTSSNGRPHLRVENRVLPAGPTVIDMLANSAFYYGMLRTLSEEDRPLWTKMSFAAAQQNFVDGRPPTACRQACTGRDWAR